jgi:DNA-binding transcriptional LysR family regulator
LRGDNRRFEQGLRPARRHRLRRSGLDIKLDHGVNNIAMAMSLAASTRGLALMPAYAKYLLPRSVVSRLLEGEAHTIDVAVGYSKSNTSPILKLFLSRLDELVGPNLVVTDDRVPNAQPFLSWLQFLRRGQRECRSKLASRND